MRLDRFIAVAAVAACLAPSPAVLARGGDLDAAFGTAGFAPIGASQVPAYVFVAPGPEGTLLAVRSDPGAIKVTRLRADGQPDPSFGTAGVTQLPGYITAFAIAVQADGTVVIAGPRTQDAPASLAGWGYARLTRDGILDARFGVGGWATAGSTSSYLPHGMVLRVLADGRIVTVIHATDVQGAVVRGHMTIVRLRPDGTGDPAYGTGGVLDNAFGYTWDLTVALGSERVLDDGGVEFVRPVAGSVGFSRLTPGGAVDATLGVSGTRISPAPFGLDQAGTSHLRFLADGSIAADRLDANAARTGDVLSIARLAPGGAMQKGFGRDGVTVVPVVPLPTVAALASPDGGLVIVVGAEPNQPFQVTKLDATGQPDARFGVAGTVTSFGRLLPVSAVMAPDGYVDIEGAGLTVGSNGPQYGGDSVARLQAVADVVEFHNTNLDHYFIAYDGDEASGIDAGAAGPGWTRTGASFVPGGPAPVCRFYGTPGIGPNSHFYTAEPDECELVKHDPGWTYEGVGFQTTRSANGACPSPLVSVHRLYNDGFARHVDSNHRYVTDVSLIEPMAARGWVHEGVVFCAKP